MTEQRAFYHDGMRALQDRFDGRRVADRLAEHRRRWDFWDDDRVLIENTPFFFIATSYGDYTDCSMRSGMPGFVKIVAPGTIEFPEYDGNSMYRTLGNISRNPNVGLLFVKFDGKTYRVRINGRATIHRRCRHPGSSPRGEAGGTGGVRVVFQLSARRARFGGRPPVGLPAAAGL